MHDSVAGAAAAPEEEGGGQLTLPLTAVLPEGGNEVVDYGGRGGTGGSVVDGSPCDESIGFEERRLVQRRPAALPTSERN